MLNKELFRKELVNAMKNKENNKKECLQILIANIINKEIEKKNNLSEEEIISVIRKEIKGFEETILMSNGRNVNEYREQIEYLTQFIPEQYSEKEIMHIIKKMCDGMTEKNRIMKTVIPLFRGRADNRVVSSVVDEFLKR